MTVSATPAEISYEGAGSPGPFSFPFLFFSGYDLVAIKIVDGELTRLNYPDDFSVTGTDDPDGGAVTLAVDLEVGETLSLVLEPVNEQDTSYTGDSPFPSESTEQALDRLTMITKRLQTMQTRQRTEDVFSDSGVVTLDLSRNVGVYRLEMIENITSVDITNPPPVGTVALFSLRLEQDGTGGWTYASSNAIHSGSGLVTTAGTINRIDYQCDFEGNLEGVIYADFD